MSSDVLIVGSPNSGKSFLFNRLTGLQQKVANFPGITVELKRGSGYRNPELDYIDFPGVYSLNTLSMEEEVAANELKAQLDKENLKAVVYVLDATRLERSLVFALQVQCFAKRTGRKILFALNMWDEVQKHGLELDVEGLSRELMAPVIPLSAKTGFGINDLEEVITSLKETPAPEHCELLSGTELRKKAHTLAKSFGPKGDLLIRAQSRIDAFLVSHPLGALFFFLLMFLLFQSIFTWASPFMDLIENIVVSSGEFVSNWIPAGFFHDFVNDALFGGIGSFVVFVPQIFILTFIVGLMEDSGYLARAAVLCHRPLKAFGLSGKSFVPMLSGFACAIPGIYAARTIESPKKRFLTYFALPLMACSARLPVYALLISAFIPAKTVLGGLFGLRGLAFFGIYLFGLIIALLVTGLLSQTKAVDKDDAPFILEMPPFRFPSLMANIRQSLHRSKLFLTKAGVIIFVTTVVVWFLGYFPNGGEDLATSYLGSLGKFVGPIFEPLGVDWRYGVAILTSFLAREVFVSTLGAMFGIEGADENVEGFAENVKASGITFASGMGLLVFYAIAMQCVSTLAVIKRETGSWKVPAQIFILYSVLAYILAWSCQLIF